VIGLLEENCTVCMLCARECPDWLHLHRLAQGAGGPLRPQPGAPERGGPPAGGRPAGAVSGVRNAVDRFAIDFSLCMYCGICIEVCPYDALFWAPEFSYAEPDMR